MLVPAQNQSGRLLNVVRPQVRRVVIVEGGSVSVDCLASCGYVYVDLRWLRVTRPLVSVSVCYEDVSRWPHGR